MTNQELDHWLAEKVMGWVSKDFQWIANDGHRPRLGIVNPDPDPYESGCAECDWWHPTTNIAQAIEAAEKARTKGRIGDWVLLSPAWNSISRPMAEITLDGGFFFSRDADAYSLALCRAIHEALRDRP